MNRVIKFRGKDQADIWHFGDLLHGENAIFIDDTYSEILGLISPTKVLAETVGQFVIQTPKYLNKFGKDGNYDDFYDLYEDDIVQARESFVYYNSVYPFPCKTGDKFVLSHYDAGFCLVPINKFENWAKDGRSPIMGGIIDNYELWNLHKKFVPIGNIHDNPELIKKEV